jgi:acetyl esterase/lipase
MKLLPASLDRKTFVCPTTAGHALEVDVIGGDTSMLRPCVMWIHGGGLIFGSRTISPRPFFIETLIDLGFVIVSVDHRLAPEVKLAEIVDDVGELWRWLHDEGPSRFGAEPGRICIAGASAGAYLSLLAGYKFLPKPRAIASLWGFGDITATWEAEPSKHYLKAPMVSRSDAWASLRLTSVPTASGEDRSLFYLYCRQQGLWLPEVTGHALPDQLAWLRQFCPLYHIEQDFPPTVLVHGRDDSDVPASESDNLAATLRAKGVRHEYHSLPGVGHGFAGGAVELVQSTERAVAEFLHSQVSANEA